MREDPDHQTPATNHGPPPSTVAAATIARNLDDVRGRIAEACARAGREPSEVRLVAVTKSVGMEEVRALVELDATDIGENRPLELVRRAQAAADRERIHWHLVGHLQRNKIRKMLPFVAWIHAVDSVRLVRALAQEVRRAAASGPPTLAAPPQMLIEINTAQEVQKTGLAPAQLEAVLTACREEGLAPRGLMTMAPYGAPADELRALFGGLGELRDRAVARGWAEALPELSMGMTDDFEIAVEEGATMVRIGRALFHEPAA